MSLPNNMTRTTNPASDALDEFDAATLEALGVPYVPPKNLTIEDAIRCRGESAIMQTWASGILEHIVETIFVRLHYRAGEKGAAPATRYEADNAAATAGLTRDLQGRMSAEARRRLFSNITDGKGIIEKRLISYLRKVTEPVWHTLLPCEQAQDGRRVPGATRLDGIAFMSPKGEERVDLRLRTTALPPYHEGIMGYASVQAAQQASDAFKSQLRRRLAGQSAVAPVSISQRLATVPEALGNLAEKAVLRARSAADVVQREIERRTGSKPIVGSVGDAPRTEDATDSTDIASLSIVELQQRIRPSVKFWRALFGSLRVESMVISGTVTSLRQRLYDVQRNLELWHNEYKVATSEEIEIAETYFEHSLGELAGYKAKSQRLNVSRELFDYYTLRQREDAPGEPYSYRIGVFDGMRFLNRTFDSAREDLQPGQAAPHGAAKLKEQPLTMAARNADFSELTIPGAYFYECRFPDARFDKCDLERSIFGLCKDLSSTIFDQASLRGAKFVFTNPEAKKKKGHELMHFVDADLTEARFEHGELFYCNFSNAQLTDAVFHHMKLINCDFRGAKGNIRQVRCTVESCLIDNGDKVSTFAELQAYLARDEQRAAKQTAKTAESKTKRKGNPGESSFEQPLWFCVSEDGRRVAVRTEEGEWLVPPPPIERLIVASVVTDGVAIAPFPMLTAYGQLPTVVGNTDDEFDAYRVANPKKPVTFPPIFLNVQPHSLGELTGYDVYAAKNSVTLREQPLGWLPLRAALAYSILSKNTGIQQANRALKNMGHLLAAPAFLQAEDIVPRIKMTGMQNDKAAEMVEADRWAYNLSVHAPRLYDAELLRYLCYVTGLPTGVGLAKASFTLALMGHNLPCLDARLLAVVYGGEQVKAATASMARLNAKKKAGQLEGARLLSRNDAVDVYLDECRRIFAQFAYMPEDAPFYFSRSQWALWERSPKTKRGRAVEATLHTHEEFAELIDAID